VNVFPTFIETMIYREVAALRSMGYEILPFSVRRPAADQLPPEGAQFVEGTHYILPMSPWRVAAAHVRAMFRWPRRYWTMLLRCTTGAHGKFHHRVRTFGHFVWAIPALPALERAGVSHIHAHWATGPTTAAMVASRLLGIPFSFTAHAYDVWREQLLLAEKLRAAVFSVTCTEYNRQHLATTYAIPVEKIVTVHHGVDVHRFGPVQRAMKVEPLIISVGRMVEQKGFDRLLRVCKQLVESGESFRCEIVGDGPLRSRLGELVERYGLRDRVTLPGRLHQEQLLERYAAADIFVLFCVRAGDDDRDGIPNVLIEAMATELPVVSTRGWASRGDPEDVARPAATAIDGACGSEAGDGGLHDRGLGGAARCVVFPTVT